MREDASRSITRLDPFGYWPGFASKIVGLGGEQPATVDDYAFHTPYVLCGAGRTTFTLRFADLVARRGRLTLRVHRVPRGEETAKAVLVKIVSLADLRGEVSLRLTAAEGDRLALVGLAYGDCAAAATALAIEVDHVSTAAAYLAQLNAARETIFVPDTGGKAGATLARPLSQTCTAAQFEEPDYDRWIDRLRISKQRHRKQWEFIYILQALEHFGKLQRSSRGVGFGVGVEYLPAYMASVGCQVLGTDLPEGDNRSAGWHAGNQHSAGLANLFYPELCAPDTFAANVSFRAVDMNHIPDDIVDYDFTWSSCAFEHLGSIAAGLRFVERSLDCLKQGGLAVHTSELNLTSNDETVDEGHTVLFRKRDYERLAAELRAKGHGVAPLIFDPGTLIDDDYIDLPPYSNDVHLKLLLGQYVTTSFGLIVRKHAPFLD